MPSNGVGGGDPKTTNKYAYMKRNTMSPITVCRRMLLPNIAVNLESRNQNLDESRYRFGSTCRRRSVHAAMRTVCAS